MMAILSRLLHRLRYRKGDVPILNDDAGSSDPDDSVLVVAQRLQIIEAQSNEMSISVAAKLMSVVIFVRLHGMNFPVMLSSDSARQLSALLLEAADAVDREQGV
jgi:hypothetical protein